MSEIYVVWSTDRNKAAARLLEITQGRQSRVLRRSQFDLAQAENLDNDESTYSVDATFAMVIEVWDENA